jgi:hypothetical protein
MRGQPGSARPIQQLRFGDSLLAPFTTIYRPNEIGTLGGCLSRSLVSTKLLCRINMLTKCLSERLQQVLLQVIGIFNAYREAHGAFTHQRLRALLGRVVAAVQ